jgi:hypothetical protein
MMFDRLVVLVNRMRTLGNKEWDENKVASKMLRIYRAKNNMLAFVIMERPGYEDMTPQELLAKIKHHESLEEDAINAHNQNPIATGYNKPAWYVSCVTTSPSTWVGATPFTAPLTIIVTNV